MADENLIAKVNMNHTHHFIEASDEVISKFQNNEGENVTIIFPNNFQECKIRCHKFYVQNREPSEICRAACENIGIRNCLCSSEHYMKLCATANPEINSYRPIDAFQKI